MMIDSNFIVTYLLAIFGFYIFVFSFNYFIETKLKINTKNIIIIAIISFIMAINNLHNIPYLKIPITIFIITMFFFVVYKESFYKCLFLSSFLSLISLLTEFILSIIASIILLNITMVNNPIFIKIFFTLLSFWSFYYICRMPFIKIKYIKFYKLLESKKEVVLYIFFFLFMISSMYEIFALDFNNIKLYLLSMLTIFIFGIIIYLYFKELHNNQILNIKNKYLIQNQQLFKNTLDDYRVLKHNLLNDFLFINSLCNKEVQKIITKKISKYNIDVDNFNDINNIPEGLQGILYFKSSVARKQNIEFYIDGNSNIKTDELNIKLYIDLCEAIGIIIDNAIEATLESEFKAIYFNLQNDNHYITIKVLNTYNNDVDLDYIGNKNYSTKNRNSGLGLYYIKKLNKNIQIKKSIINDLFKIEVIAKIK